MANKVFIRANSPQGLPVVVRAGRHWPAGATTEVEVVELKEGDDVKTTELTGPSGEKVKTHAAETKGPGGETVLIPDPNKLTPAEFDRIKQDSRFSVLSNPKAEEDLTAAKAENEALRRRVAELEAQLGKQGGGETATFPAAEGAEAAKRRTAPK